MKDVIKAGYNRQKYAHKLAEKGYVLDTELSNHNNQVYYNPTEKKTIVNVSGSHNVGDFITATSILTGRLRDTKRYKEARRTTERAKSKYDGKVTLVGHSLGGSIVSAMPSEDRQSKVTYNKGTWTPDSLKPSRKDETHYRTLLDPTSIFAAVDRNTRVIPMTYWDPHSSNNLDSTAISV